MNVKSQPYQALTWPQLLALFGVPTLLNYVACRLAIPWLDGLRVMPIEAAYFLCVGLLVLKPMLLGAIFLNGGLQPGWLDRMRIRRLSRTDWWWTLGGFVALSLASFVLAKVVAPRLGFDSMPFFFQNLPLSAPNWWLLGVWPLFFFFNIFGEEFLWRGYILPRQELLNGRWTWLVHGCLWSVWHLPMGLDLVFTALPTFFILPAVVQVRQNTTISIVVHAVFGGFGFLALALGLVH